MLDITQIPAPRIPLIDERTGLLSRQWYRFFYNLYVLTGGGTNAITLEELQLGPPNQPDFTEILKQVNNNISPEYQDQSGNFLATLDAAQLMAMMARFETAEAAIQGAYLQPVVQTGTIANYNLDNSPTAGGVVYGTGSALAVSVAGTSGQVLKSNAAGAPTWVTDGGGTVTAVSVVTANGLAGSSSGGATPALTLSTTVTGVVKGNGTALSAAAAATDYVAPSAYASANGLTMATLRLLGRTTASTGAAEEISVAGGLTLSAGTLTGTSGTVTAVTGTAPVVSSGGTAPAISMPVATALVDGYLSSTDWATFNAKQPAGSYLVSGGALGTPSSGTVTNLTGTASININGTVGATTATTGKFTTIEGTDTTDASSTTAAALKTAGGLAVVKKIYVGDNVVIATSGKGIDFSATAGTGTSELFADYEEGTWTGTLTGSVTGATTPVTETGTYTKAGRLVTVSILLDNKNMTGSSGNLQITGLPFSSASMFHGSCSLFGFVATAPIVQSSATTIIFFEAVAGTAIATVSAAGTYARTSITYIV